MGNREGTGDGGEKLDELVKPYRRLSRSCPALAHRVERLSLEPFQRQKRNEAPRQVERPDLQWSGAAP